jgi:EmrB/QacA subfamily drug resistance transporter
MVGFLISTAPALPLVQRDLGARFDELQWVLTAYSLGQASFLVVGGALGDRLGHRRVYLVGLGGYATMLVACAAAPSTLALILLAAVTGVVSAFALGNALTVLGQSFAPDRRGPALAAWGVSIGIAYAAGPLLGGYVAQHVGWRVTFMVLGVLAAIGMAVAIPSVRREEPAGGEGFDVPGVVLLIGGFGLVLTALNEGNRWGWGSAPVLACAVVGAAVLATFVAWQARARAPVLDLALLREPLMSAAILATLVLSIGFFAVIFYLPAFFSAILDATPDRAAVELLGVTGTCVAASLVTLRLRRQVSERALVVIALLALAGGALLTSRVEVSWGYPSLLPGFLLFGLGIGMINGPLAALVAEAAGPSRSGVANATVYSCRLIGGALGIAGFGALLQAQIRSELALPNGVDHTAVVGAVTAGDIERAASGLPAGADSAFRVDAQLALVHGLGTVFLLLAAAFALAAATTLLLVLRARRASTTEATGLTS